MILGFVVRSGFEKQLSFPLHHRLWESRTEAGWVEAQRPPCCQDEWMAEVGEPKRGRE